MGFVCSELARKVGWQRIVDLVNSITATAATRRKSKEPAGAGASEPRVP